MPVAPRSPGPLVATALTAAETATASVEVIDLRTLNPLDMATVAASVRRTGRAVVMLVSVFQCVCVLFSVLVIVKAYCFTQRNIQQSHQLPGFGFSPGSSDKCF